MSLAEHVRILGRGQGRARSMTQPEAQDAMRIILAGEAAPEAVGALLMLLRMKGETAAEIAGFTAAARASLPAWQGARPALDWPSYAAGRTRGLPWFLLAARLVAQAGFPVLLHGWNSHQGQGASVRAALGPIGIGTASNPAQASALLERDGIAYLPLEAYSPRLLELLRLRDVLGLRSCINTVLRMTNPGGAGALVQGVFHPTYRELQSDAAGLLGHDMLSVLKGGGGEFEHHPTKDISVYGLRRGQRWSGTTGRAVDGTRRLADGRSDQAALIDLWSGRLDDPFAQAVVVSTAALALDTIGLAEPARLARDLWADRPSLLAGDLIR